MARYTNLPAEVRQHILLLVLQQSDRRTTKWLPAFQTLILLNRQSFEDMRTLASNWPLPYDIQAPARRTFPTDRIPGPLCLLPPPLVVRLSLFSFTRMEATYRSMPLVTSEGPVYRLVLRRWISRVWKTLQPGVKTILVDATPAPRFCDEQDTCYPSITGNDHVCEAFQPSPQYLIVDLLVGIRQIIGMNSEIILVGTYSAANRWTIGVIQALCASRGAHIKFEVELVPTQS